MRHKFLFTLCSLVVGLLLFSCTDEEMENRLDAVENRLDAIETQIGEINSSMIALQTILDGKTIVTDVKKEGEIYKLYLLDGSVLTISAIPYTFNAPQLSMDKNGFWRVSYDDGASWSFLLDNEGEKVCSAPVLDISDDGHWVINGVKTAVKAEASGSAIMKSINLDGDVLTITLADGRVAEISVDSSFSCAVYFDEACLGRVDYTEVPIAFYPGTTMTYYVKLVNHSQVAISAPEGWKAVLEEHFVSDGALIARLSVLSPLTTRAILASSESDVVITSTAKDGRVAIAKLRVSCQEAPEPVASISLSEVGTSTLTFSVSLINATSYYSKLVKGSNDPDAFTAETLMEEGAKGTEKSLTFSDLEQLQTYTLYLVAEGVGGKVSEVYSVSGTTKEVVYANNLEKYDAGAPFVFCGQAYSKKDLAKSKVIYSSKNQALSGYMFTEGFIFLDDDAGTGFTMGGNIYFAPGTGKTCVILSYDSSKPAKIVCSSNIAVELRNGSVVMADLGLDASARGAGYILHTNSSNSAADTDVASVRFDGCSLVVPQMVFQCSTKPERAIEDIAFHNNRIKLSQATSNLVNAANTTVLEKYSSVSYVNNLIYTETANAKLTIFNYGGTTHSESAAWDGAVLVKGNTFYNVSPNTNGFYHAYGAKSIEWSKNLFVAKEEGTPVPTGGLFRFRKYGMDYDADDNYCWGYNGDYKICAYSTFPNYASSFVKVASSEPVRVDDLASGGIVSALPGYGASLKQL